jgi:hypothetical protein
VKHASLNRQFGWPDGHSPASTPCYTLRVKNSWRVAISFVLLIAAALSSRAAAQNSVTVELGPQAPGTTFGVGGIFRPSEFTAIRLKLTSTLSEPTPVWVQWQVPNADGDIQEIGRSLTLTPNQPAFTWLYAWLAHDVDLNSVWTVRVFEERDGVRRGELGGARISPTTAGAQIVELESGMIAVVGEKRLGLDGYGNFGVQQLRQLRPIGGHEDTRVAWGLKPNELPDRWEGLLPFEAVAWAGSNVEPLDLSLDQATALREYIRRGGHLIISLPDRDIWGLGAVGKNQLEDLLPCRTENLTPRREEAPLNDLIPILSKYDNLNQIQTSSRPKTVPLRVFRDLKGDWNVIDNFYQPLIAMKDGRVIAIQRTFGHGHITVIGLDLADGQLNSVGSGLPQADAFWNRVLGRRMDTPNPGELNQLFKDGKIGTGINQAHGNSLGSGALITGGGERGINLTSRANVGLLLAFVLFVAYWLIAGPAGFAILKSYGLVRHAWVAFAGCAALFTAIAWSSISLVPKTIEIKHITFLDHIWQDPNNPRGEADPQLQRALSFFSVYLPDYGKTEVAIASDAGQRDLLSTWTPPGSPVQYFPNVDRFPIDVARSPNKYEIPSRSTSTSLCAHWMGGVDPKWGSMLRVVQPITVVNESESGPQIQGSIVNELPGTLKDVAVIWVRSNRSARKVYDASDMVSVSRSTSGAMLNSGSMWREPSIDSGAVLDFKKFTGASRLVTNLRQKYTDPYTERDLTASTASGAMHENTRRSYIEMLSMFNQLTPPEYIRPQSSQDYSDVVIFQRHMGRELDLSPWFSQPCLIIIGYLEDSQCPVPLRVDGDDEPPTSKGLTVVRWIHPLELNEQIAFPEVFETSAPPAEVPPAEAPPAQDPPAEDTQPPAENSQQ